jgi:flagellar hook-associated protein 2
MAGSLSILGLGSNGALNYDIIEKLRGADNRNQVTPIDKKLTATTTKLADLSILTTMAASFKSATSTLSDEMSYLQRSSSVSGDSVNVSVLAGTLIQDFSVDVISLAQSDIIESKAFSSETATFATSAQTVTINIDGTDYNIEVDASTTITQFKNEIFDKTNGKVSASILNVGGDNPYKLILKSTDTGSNQAITITSTGTATDGLGITNNYTYTATASTNTHAGIDETLTFNVNGVDYDITVTSGDGISEINTKVASLGLGNELTSSIKNGALVLTSNDNSLTITGASATTFGLDSLTKTTTTNKLQNASNASLLYNGVSISRTSNSFDDLIVGVSITLNETGKSNIAVKQDTKDITKNLEAFVAKYNELISNLNESTKYDIDTKASGSFQGISEIVTMKSNINRQLLSVDENGRNLTEYGIALNDAGILEFDKSIIDAKLLADSKGVESFFRGVTTPDTTIKVGSIISSGVTDITAGDFNINGTDIVVSLTGTASENAIALKNAINSANISGIEVALDNSNSYIILKSSSGNAIEITGDNAKLSSIGFTAGTVRGTSETTTGVFSTFNNNLKNLISGDHSTLSLFEKSLETEKKSLQTERGKTITRLDAKYDTMVARFAAYDSIIGKLNSQFQALSMMIKASYADK